MMLSSRRLLLVVFLFFYLPMVYYWGWLMTKTVGFDFPSFYFAAQRAFVFGRSPYGKSALKVGSAVLGWKVNPYLYPPPSLLAFWPLANLSILDAQTLFTIASHLCLLGSIWLLLRRLRYHSLQSRFGNMAVADREPHSIVGISLVYILCSDAVLRTLGLGQVNLIVLFFLCLALTGIREKSPAWRIALPLSVAILLKTYPVLLLAPLLFRKQYRAIGLTVAFFAAFTGVAFLALPNEVWTDWLFQIAPNGGYANSFISPAFAWNQSINGWVTRLLVDSEFSRAPLQYADIAKAVATTLSLAVVGVTLYSSWRLRRVGNGESDDEIATYLLMIFLVAPLSWDHHLVYILPAVVLAIRYLVSGKVGPKGSTIMTVALFLVAWNIPLDQPGWKDGWWTLLISVKFYSVIALWIFFVCRIHQSVLVRRLPVGAHDKCSMQGKVGLFDAPA
jgi:hypothetical protein